MRTLVMLLAAGVVLASCVPTSVDYAAEAEAPKRKTVRSFVAGSRLLKTEKAVPGRYIVVLDEKALGQEAEGTTRVGLLAHQLAGLHGASVKRVYSRVLQGFAATMPEAAALKLSNDPRVRYVEEDGAVSLSSTQTNAPWGLDRIDQRELPLNGTYQYDLTGSGVHAYIIDSGIRLTHADFGGRAVHGFSTIEDGEGSNDCNGHGTHVAGTLGGTTHGVAKGVTLHAVRVLDCSGEGTWSGVIAGVDWVTAHHVKPAVANMSLGGGAMQSVDDALTASINAGVTYVVSAGNSRADACLQSPARLPAALTVGATHAQDVKSYSSNYGACVDLFAPGEDILSAWNTSDTSTTRLSGTSMAAPHVAGTAALYLERHPLATPGEVSTWLTTRATLDEVYDSGSGSPNRLLYAGCILEEQTTELTLSAPLPGAVVSGQVTLAATVTDGPGVTRVEFFLGDRRIGSDDTAPYELVWNSGTVRNGPAVFTARASDAHCTVGVSAPVEVTIANEGDAVFEPARGAPACAAVGSRCDSGELLKGRANLGPEPHQPNTVGGSCADLPDGTYLKSPSLERLFVFRSDGSSFQAGKEVTVQATVYAELNEYTGYYESISLFAAADASNPTWTYLTTLWPNSSGLQVLTANYLLPAGGLQALRGVYRRGSGSQACIQHADADHDDLLFAVGQEPDTQPPGVTITSLTEGATVSGGITVDVEASDNYGVQRVEIYKGTTLVATRYRAPYGWGWNSRSEPNGPYSFTARAYDAAGNVSQSTVNVVVDNDFTPPEQPTITAPASGATLSGTVSIEVSASDDRQVARVEFFLDGELLGTDTTAPFAFSWDTVSTYNGSHTLSVTAYDGAEQSATSATITVETNNPGNAHYDPVLKAPRCDTVTERCDSRTLTRGRGPGPVAYGNEQHSPNTLDGCLDGTSTSLTQAVQRVRVLREDGTVLAAGKRVRIEVDVWSSGYAGPLRLYAAADATAPVWTHIANVDLPESGRHTLSAEYVLPAGSLQAVRAAFGMNGGSGPCGTVPPEESWFDRDDLVFAVGQEVDTVPPEQVVLTAPAEGATVTGSVTLTASASDNFGVAAMDFFVGQTLIGTATQAPFSVSWNSRSVPNGGHTLTARARDLAGNAVSSPPVTVTTDNDFIAPGVSLTAPAPGARLSGTVTLSANATDDRGVISRVEFYAGTWQLCSDTSAPFSCSWQTQYEYKSKYVLTARAYDAAGNLGTSQQVEVTILEETTPPAISITAPASGTTAVGTVTISASATDASGVSRVEFLLDGALLGTDTSSPYSYAWDTRTAANGRRTLTARATDTLGNVATSAGVLVTIDSAAPAVAVTSPAHGATVAGLVPLQVDATDNEAVTKVEFYVDGVLLASDTTAPYGANWDSGPYVNGSHTLLAKAYDAVNNVGTSAQVTVMTNQPGSATYDPVVRAPKCATLNNLCDTTGLVKSRYTYEPNSPNTINRSCDDGMAGAWNQEQLHRIRLSSVDGALFSRGGRVRLEVHVNVFDPNLDALDLFYASDANNPSWTYLTTLKAGASGAQVLSTEYVLPAGFLQAVRAQFRQGGDASSACSRGSYDERDDMVFAVDADATVAITGPSNQAQVRGLVPVTATATDEQGVAKVEFYADGVLIGTDTSAPYETSWDSSAVADGEHALTAKAYGTGGRVATSPPRGVIVDHTPPDAALTSPTPGTFLRPATVTLKATASDTRGISKVEFYVDGTLTGTDTSAPYAVDWAAWNSPVGAHTLTVKAFDLVGNARTSAGVGVIIDGAVPTAHITAPAYNPDARYRGVLQISASASDDVGVERVEFYVGGGQLIGTDSSAPYETSWDSRAVADGSYSITCKAYDLAGNVNSSYCGIVVKTDNTLPDAALTSPTPGTLVQGIVSLEATASDNVGVTQVLFYDGTRSIGFDNSAPYAMSWDTRSVSSGTHTLTVRAYDRAGNERISAEVAVTVDNTPPVTAISAPAQNALVRGTVPVNATASDDVGVERVEFYAGTTLLGTATTAPYEVSWDTTAWADGSVSLTTRAYDRVGNVAQSSIRTVSVDNTGPAVAITSPANGASLFLSTTIQANASDNVGVTQVVFYDGGTVIGTDTTAPYSVSWNLWGVSKGTHTLTAKAHDVAGNITTSAPVSVKVN
jgi:subtilisin family serine protease